MSDFEKLTFETEDGVVDFFVLDETRINGCNYLLVADSMEEDGMALILKDVAPEDSNESIYEPVEDEAELDAVAGMFKESLEDINIE